VIGRRVPLFETETIRLVELVGKTGRLVVGASPTTGAAQVRDGRGNLHQVTCRTDAFEQPLPSGTEVILVEYQQERRSFVVAAYPPM
jgi:hypothetical protein